MDSDFHKLVGSEVQKKGFMVYDYIDLDELLMTVRKDYLDILSFINIPFGIVSIVLWVVSYSSWFSLLIWFLLLSYAIIFCILFFRLIQKTYYFFLLKNVLITKKGIILGKELYTFGQEKKLHERLMKYENIFLEYLGGKSRLNEYIDSKKKDLVGFWKHKKYIKKIWDFIDSDMFSWGGREMWKLVVPAVLSVILYIIFMYVFYYLWYFFWLLLVKVYGVWVQFVLHLRANTEYKIKRLSEKIDENIEKMAQIFKLMETKYESFSDGEIANISKFTKTHFDSFYTEIFMVYKDKKKLQNMILNWDFRDFIDFHIFEKYLKWEFNKPVNSMLKLLKNYEKLLSKNLKDLQKSQAKDKALSWTLKTKERIIENNLLLIQANIQKLSQSLI